MPIDRFEYMSLRDASEARAMFAAGLALAAQHGLTMRPPPPEPTMGCGRGCNGCVWDGYLNAAEFWRDDLLTCLRPSPHQAGT